jgi:hypothetical protein
MSMVTTYRKSQQLGGEMKKSQGKLFVWQKRCRVNRKPSSPSYSGKFLWRGDNMTTLLATSELDPIFILLKPVHQVCGLLLR